MSLFGVSDLREFTDVIIWLSQISAITALGECTDAISYLAVTDLGEFTDVIKNLSV